MMNRILCAEPSGCDDHAVVRVAVDIHENRTFEEVSIDEWEYRCYLHYDPLEIPYDPSNIYDVNLSGWQALPEPHIEEERYQIIL